MAKKYEVQVQRAGSMVWLLAAEFDTAEEAWAYTPSGELTDYSAVRVVPPDAAPAQVCEPSLAEGEAVYERVDHPPHYNANPSGVECIAVVEHMNFNVGNAIKYLWRAGFKGALLEDLKKARWYVDREIQRIEKAGKP